jgi:hypothetical protein
MIDLSIPLFINCLLRHSYKNFYLTRALCLYLFNLGMYNYLFQKKKVFLSILIIKKVNTDGERERKSNKIYINVVKVFI